MTKSKKRIFWLIYGTALTLFTLLLGTLFIVQVWSIFHSAPDNPFTVSIIKEKFSEIAVFVWLWIAIVAIGGVLSYAFPESETRPKAYVSVEQTLSRLKGVWAAEDADLQSLRKKSYIRYAVYGVVVAMFVAVTTLCLVWLFDTAYTPAHDSTFFTEHGAVADRLFKMMPWLLVAMVVWAAAVIFRALSLQEEASYVKAQIAAGKRKPREAQTSAKAAPKKCVLTTKQRQWLMLGLRVSLCAVAVVLLIVGVLNDGMIDVYEKAKNICTQCIGLG